MDMRNRLQRLQERRYDNLTKSTTLSNAATNPTLSDTEKYLIGSMEPVSSQQTEIVLRTGERVKNQLESYLNNEGLYPEFAYQGSVTNNTHIKVNSDIDLIVASGSFFTAAQGAFVSWLPYFGDETETIRTLRNKCKNGLETRFYASTVKSKARCIGISDDASLQRTVDVIPCSWIKNRNYEQTCDKVYLGIQGFDVEKNCWFDNYPFLHNALLEIKDDETHGNLKRIIRLLKTLREDASIKIDISSYDICGIAYSFDSNTMMSKLFDEPFEFLERFLSYSKQLENNLLSQILLQVPNQTRSLFSNEGLKVSELKKLNAELNSVLDDVRAIHAANLRMAFARASLNNPRNSFLQER